MMDKMAVAIYKHLYDKTAANELHKEMVTEEIEDWLRKNDSHGSTENLAIAFEEILQNKVYKNEYFFCNMV